MSILGKILVGLNLLALVAFGALGFLDYEKRTQWSHAIMTYDVALNGLHVDDKETDPYGKPKAAILTDQAVTDVGGSKDVKTQMKYVEKVKTDITQKIDQEGSLTYVDPKDPTKTKNATVAQKQAYVLLRLAPTLDKRQELLDVWYYEDNPERLNDLPPADRATEEKRIKDLKDGLAQRLNDAFSAEKLAGTKGLKDRNRMRQGIADLLVSLHDAFPAEADKAKEDPFERDSYKKVLAVCGARAVSEALNRKASQLEALAGQLTALINQERLAFADEHQLQLYYVMERYAEWGRQQVLLAEATKQATVQRERRDEQKKVLDAANDKLKTAQSETDVELKRLDRLQQMLYETRLKLRDANRINQDLEKQIRDLESKIGPSRPSTSKE